MDSPAPESFLFRHLGRPLNPLRGNTATQPCSNLHDRPEFYSRDGQLKRGINYENWFYEPTLVRAPKSYDCARAQAAIARKRDCIHYCSGCRTGAACG